MTDSNYESIDEAICAYIDKGSYNSKKEFWSVSSLGRCKRQQYLRRSGVSGVFTVSYSSRMQAYDGDGIHAKIQSALQKMGVLVNAEETITNIPLQLRGRYDALVMLKSGLCLMDIKTQNQKAWARRKKKGVRSADAHHRRQVLAYLYLLKEHYPDLKDARIYYVNRNTGEREEFRLAITEEDTKSILAELQDLNRHWADQTLPPLTEDANDCQFCEFSSTCYGNSPVPKGRYF